MTQIKRPHYFKGQFLKADDFIAEQQYHMQMRRLHNSSLHMWGVVDGLNVTANDAGIKISAGSAIDSNGKEICLPEGKNQLPEDKTQPQDDTNFPIPASTPDGSYFVVLSYKEGYDPGSPYPAATASELEDYKYIRKVETGERSLVAKTPPPANEATLLKLALVNITAGKVTGQPDNSVRRTAAGFRANGNNLEIRPVTRDGSVVIGSDLIINSDKRILLKDGDRNHGIRYSWEGFAGKHVDGPVIHGYGGGALGIKHYDPSQEEIVLAWDANGGVGIGTKDIQAKLVVKGGKLEQVPGKFSTTANDRRVIAGDDSSFSNIAPGDLVEMGDERREVESVAADGKSLTVKTSAFNKVYLEGTAFYVMRPAPTTPIFRADNYRGDSEVLISSDGKVGIGTASPWRTSDLHIRRDAKNSPGPTLLIQNGGGLENAEARIEISTYDLVENDDQPNFRLRVINDATFGANVDFTTMPTWGNLGKQSNLLSRLYIRSDGNIGIATTAPQARLAVKASLLPIEQARGSFQTTRGTETTLESEGADLSKIRIGDVVEMSGVRRKVTSVTGSEVFVEAPGFAASAIPATIQVFRPAPAIRVEDPDGRPAFTVSGNGVANISGGSSYAADNSRMAPGSLTIGSCDASFGGGGAGWTNNTAGLLFETKDNTEIAVNNHGIRLMSLLYYEGGTVNRISIGRSMGNGYISKLYLNGNVGIGKQDPRTELDTWTGVMSGAANDYQKAQYTMSGGGLVTWGGPGNRLKWSNRFIAISMGGKPECFAEGFVDIFQPKTDIPAAQVYDASPRSASEAEGIVLKHWEALYAVHDVGKNKSAITFRIEAHTKEFYAPSNWLLVALVNGDDGSVKLGTGAIVSAKSSSSKGGSLPCGTILMWYGAVADIPDGWALCNGSNGTPDLRSRFVMGAGGNYGPNVMAGEEMVTLGVEHLPPHNHANGDRDQLLRANKGGGCTAGSIDITDSEPNVRDQSATIRMVGGGLPHENRPPFCTLCFIMKVFA